MARKKKDDEKGEREAKKQPVAKRRKAAKKRPKRPQEDPLDYRHMQALSKHERVRIFAVLCERMASPKEIADELNAGLSQVSYHVSVLRECRLIVEDHKVPRRGAVEHFYRAVTPTLVPPGAWDRLPASVRRAVSLGILQAFFDDASAAMEAGVFDSAPGELSWTPLVLDKLGVEEFGQLARDFLESVLKLQAEASKRLPKGSGKMPADTTAATVFLASFLSARGLEDKKASATRRR